MESVSRDKTFGGNGSTLVWLHVRQAVDDVRFSESERRVIPEFSVHELGNPRRRVRIPTTENHGRYCRGASVTWHVIHVVGSGQSSILPAPRTARKRGRSVASEPGHSDETCSAF